MPKFQVDTLSGRFVYNAADEDQARRLGKDGGRIVVNVEQLADDDSDDSADGYGEGSAIPDPDDESAFGDEEVVVLRRSDYDRLLGVARAAGNDWAASLPDDPNAVVDDQSGETVYRTDPRTGDEQHAPAQHPEPAPTSEQTEQTAPPAGSFPNVNEPTGS